MNWRVYHCEGRANQTTMWHMSYLQLQTFGGHFFAWTPIPDVFCLRTFKRLLLEDFIQTWYSGSWGLLPNLNFSGSWGYSRFFHTWIPGPPCPNFCPWQCLSWFWWMLPGCWEIDCVRSGLCLDCLNDFFNSTFAYWAIWWGLPILFGTGIATYLC